MKLKRSSNTGSIDSSNPLLTSYKYFTIFIYKKQIKKSVLVLNQKRKNKFKKKEVKKV